MVGAARAELVGMVVRFAHGESGSKLQQSIRRAGTLRVVLSLLQVRCL